MQCLKKMLVLYACTVVIITNKDSIDLCTVCKLIKKYSNVFEHSKTCEGSFYFPLILCMCLVNLWNF